MEAPNERLQLDDLAMEVLRRRADSLAREAESEVDEDRVGLLMFALGDEWYAVRIEDVREIYNEYEITPIPCVPEFVLGVINIRGEILSVTEIRTMLRLPAAEVRPEVPPAIVVRNDSVVTAMVVDAIGDIVEVPKDSVEPPLSTTDKQQAEYVAGSVYIDGRLIAILNVDKVLTPVGGTH